ncbi:hypothetical protein [Rhodococcus globerulus]|jgi:hypothetical protein|uniref:hypothetical protein n=1 Tax=Rhodococcus globerulus TaxID=33008 RepID=UPI001F34B00E|nr:hypothetical protein [Rhodococcus globerulus]MCE4267701.1 hypothetical protein [Rhodococcus globerulus]
MTNVSGDHASEEPQSARGAPGSRGTGSTEPGGGPVDRPSGSFDDDETISGASGGKNAPAEPTAADPVVPPYEGRKESANASAFQEAENSDGPNKGGAGEPVTDPEYKATPADETPGGRTASPADEQTAAESAGSESSDSGVGPAHQTGVGRGEDKQT